MTDPTTGNTTYTFAALPMGIQALVSLSVPGSPTGITWTVGLNGSNVGTTVGNNPYAPLTIGASDTVTMTGDDFLANQLYGQGPGNASMLGTQAPVGVLLPGGPTQGGGYPSGLTLLAANFGSPSITTPVVDISASARGLVVLASSYPVQSYTNEAPWVPTNSGALAINLGSTGITGQWFQATPAPLAGYQVTFGAPCQWLIFESDFDFDFVGAARAIPPALVQVPNPAVGADWFLNLNAPVRLVSVHALLSSSAGRFPWFLVVYPGSTVMTEIPMSSAAISTATMMTGYEGAGSPFMRSGDNRALFPLPQGLVLPAGATILTQSGLAPPDQWSNINLLFAAL